MDGKLMTYELRHLLNEESGSNLLDNFSTFNFLNEAAAEVNNRIKHVRHSQSISTIASTQHYTLKADFSFLYRVDAKGRKIVRYSDGTTVSYLKEKDSDIIFRDKNSETVETVVRPDFFAVNSEFALDAQVSGTATSAGANVAGKSILVDSAGSFDDVSPGDNIHNTTDDSLGIVLSKPTPTSLATAMFGGTNDDWGSSDAYVVQPQGRYRIVIDPIPSTSGHTITVPYIARPAPVYSDYDSWLLPTQYKRPMLWYAAWLYKYRNDEPNFGDKWFVAFDGATRSAARNQNRAALRNKVTVTFKKRQVNF